MHACMHACTHACMHTYTTHSHLLWSSVIHYRLPPSIMIQGLLTVQFTCLTVFFQILTPSFLWRPVRLAPSNSHSIHFFTRSLSSFSSTCTYWHGYSVLDDTQICIWPNWCHCHSLSLAPVNPDWFYLPGLTFLVPAHPGSPGHSPGGRKRVVEAVVLNLQ